MHRRLKRLVGSVPALAVPAQLLAKLWRNRHDVYNIRQDIHETYDQTRFLRDYAIERDEKTLLVFALDDASIYSLKLYSFIATALRLEGWTIVVVLKDRSMQLGKVYFKAFDITQFVYLDDYKLNQAEIQYCKSAAQYFLRDPLSLKIVKNWSFKESWIGPQVIATLSRLRFEGTVDFNRPEVLRFLEGMLPQILEHVLKAQKLVELQSADLALTIEANYSYFGPLVDMAIRNGTDVIQMIQPWQDDALIFKRLTSSTRREHPASVACETLEKCIEAEWTEVQEKHLQEVFDHRYSGKWFLQARNQKNTKSYNRDELNAAYGLCPDKKVAVVFSHVLWDANLFYGEDLFDDYGHWFIETVKAACQNDKLNWLIKVHPANVWKRAYENINCDYAEKVMIDSEIGELPKHVKLVEADSDICTLSLFEVADYGVTVRGTSGMELACFGKPCITAGTGRYSGLGFTIDCVTQDDYLKQLSHLHEFGNLTKEQHIRAKWNAYISFLKRPWKMKSARAEFQYNQVGHHALDHNLHLLVHSLEDIREKGDLNSWADWVRSGYVDYIAHE